MSIRRKAHIQIFLICLFLLLFFAFVRFYLYDVDDDTVMSSNLNEIDDDLVLVNKLYTYSEDDLKMNGEKYLMDDPRLINKLRSKFLLPPSLEPYNFETSDLDPSMGQATEVRRVLNDKKKGFFIECGALDGEIRSNTLFMERYLDWKGLLIEADPLNFYDMVKKHRKAYISPTCLSLYSYATVVKFEQNRNMGKISDSEEDSSKKYTTVQCFPLYSYLLALNVTTVDYFSLDVEGNELDVLKTIPFDLINIRTLSVEWTHVKEGKEEIRKYMEAKGYVVFSEVTNDQLLANDYIFIKNEDSSR